jgi:large subunit ribosomal protein L17
MRHKKRVSKIGRKSSHRKATMANMASSLIFHKRIHTTTPKAKALRRYVEPLITKSKDDNTHSRRTVFKYLQNKDAVSELFRDVADKIGDRPGGYTRILKTGYRQGDNAEMCFIELVDYNENMLKTEEDKKQKSGRRRRRRGGSKKKSTTEQTAQNQDVKTADTQEATENIESDQSQENQESPETQQTESAQQTETKQSETEQKSEQEDKKQASTENEEDKLSKSNQEEDSSSKNENKKSNE